MSERPTRAEKKAAKEEERKQKREARLKSHVVACPHCGKDVLDHMTQCPYCNQPITPVNYRSMSAEKRRAIQKVTYAVGAVVAIVIIILLIVLK